MPRPFCDHCDMFHDVLSLCIHVRSDNCRMFADMMHDKYMHIMMYISRYLYLYGSLDKVTRTLLLICDMSVMLYAFAFRLVS